MKRERGKSDRYVGSAQAQVDKLKRLKTQENVEQAAVTFTWKCGMVFSIVCC